MTMLYLLWEVAAVQDSSEAQAQGVPLGGWAGGDAQCLKAEGAHTSKQIRQQSAGQSY